MNSYFQLRNVSPEYYDELPLPAWLTKSLADLKPEARILDFGCGFGQMISALKREGYLHVEGADQDAPAIEHCRLQGHDVSNLGADPDFYERHRAQFDVILAFHVLEHVPKDSVIELVGRLHSLLAPDGRLVVAVPNAQAFTGCYWAYEDFTHHTLYTTGGVYYVLRAAGFEQVAFVDIDCTAGLGGVKKVLRRGFWRFYRAYYHLMCKLLANSTHAQSPDVFSYELKVIARNRVTLA